MKVGVTGAGGFTGRYLMAALAARGHQPVPMSADLTDPGAVTASVEATGPEAVVHLAGCAFVGSDDFSGFYAVNQVGTFNLLAALACSRPGIAVLLASSAQVYGEQADGLVLEIAPLQPSNHYALSKMAMELGSAFWGEQLRLTIVRPFNYTGVDQQLRYVVPKLVDRFKRREPSVKLGNVDVERDFGDVRSVVDAYCRLIEQGASTTLNVSTGVVTSIRTVLAMLTDLTGHEVAVEVDPRLIRDADVRTLGGNNDQLRRAVPDWRPHELRDTLAWMLAS